MHFLPSSFWWRCLRTAAPFSEWERASSTTFWGSSRISSGVGDSAFTFRQRSLATLNFAPTTGIFGKGNCGCPCRDYYVPKCEVNYVRQCSNDYYQEVSLSQSQGTGNMKSGRLDRAGKLEMEAWGENGGTRNRAFPSGAITLFNPKWDTQPENQTFVALFPISWLNKLLPPLWPWWGSVCSFIATMSRNTRQPPILTKI